MINVAEFSKKLKTVIREAPRLSYVKAVERGEYANLDPARTPWVGVYRTKADYRPKALGQHAGSWMAEITVKLILQVYSSTGEKAEDELEKLVHDVVSVLMADLTVRQYVQMLNSIKVEYSYDETESNTMDYQWAFLTLVFEARTGV